jgi:phosphoribosylformylglycinamidine synthase
MKEVKALVLTGYGLNCDYETDYSLRTAGADSHRVHINEIISPASSRRKNTLDRYQILVFGGGFSWGDDHGAGVLMAAKIRHHLGEELSRFISDGKLVIGICNGFQAMVNIGLVPAFGLKYRERTVALTYNDSGNFIDSWVNLKVNPFSPCIFTRGIEGVELPVRHGEGKFFAEEKRLDKLFTDNQVVLTYADRLGQPAQGAWPENPNGSLRDIAGICDPTGRLFGLMPHPEAYNHFTNHPDWARNKECLRRRGHKPLPEEGDGIKIFRNAVDYARENLSG